MKSLKWVLSILLISSFATAAPTSDWSKNPFDAENAKSEWEAPDLNHEILFEIEDTKTLLVAKKSSQKRRAKKISTKKVVTKKKGELQQAYDLWRQKRYKEASEKLFKLSHSSKYKSKRNRIKYILGLMLSQMKLYQVAAFQFISVIRSEDTKYLTKSLEQLSVAANELNDDTLLNYAINRVKANVFPKKHKNMLFYRIGEFQIKNKQYKAAIQSLSKVSDSSSFYPRAKYLQGFAYSITKDNKRALAAFEELIDSRGDKPVTDVARVSGIMGKARVYYQMEKWDKAIEFYREIPRDTAIWHDTHFEASWAMFRSGRFRSALGNFQSLHSPFYEQTYLPESLLVRSLVYLYICQYDEMEKVLNLYVKIYKPVFQTVSRYLKNTRKPSTYFKDMVTILKDEKAGDTEDKKYPIPLIAAKKVLKEGDFQRSYDYIRKLLEERRILKAMPASWRQSGIGRYAQKTVNRRLLKARKRAGRQVRAHLLDIKEDIIDLDEQEGFIRYEMINGKKEILKKKVAGKDLPKAQVDEDSSRDYYIQNGWQYYKFRGEYWLDELGNYHYVGTRSCK